jgi:acyl carrier protein
MYKKKSSRSASGTSTRSIAASSKLVTKIAFGSCVDQDKPVPIFDANTSTFRIPSWRENLSPDDDFFKTLKIDSLQALSLLTRLEQHFHIELPDYEMQGVSDFRTLAERIQSRL